MSRPSPADSYPVVALAPPATEHTTLALKVLLEGIAGINRPKILDLGPAVGANVSFFSTYSCHLHICDLFSSIREARETDIPNIEVPDLDVFDRHLANQIPDSGMEPFDLILVWDLFDYLNAKELALLGSQLARRCRVGARIFALVSAKNRIPTLPNTYQIVNSETLRYSLTTRAERDCPKYKQPDLSRALPNLDVETSFLLRHGVQEYVFCYEPDPPPQMVRTNA